jgi:uncharacterized membrane protein YfcA
MEITTFATFVIAGFCAQLIDGSLGMGYGVSSSIFLISTGLSPLLVSASVHAAEVFTTAASGLSHLKFGNVDKTLFTKLSFSGVIGAVVGAYLLTRIPGDVIEPFVAIYLLLMGIVIVYKAFRSQQSKEVATHIIPLGIIGGFLDAVGGGGWGPIVTSTLLARGNPPRKSIGSVNLSEFFVALAVTVMLLGSVSLGTQIQVIVGLIIGGLIASPFAAFLSGRLSPRALTALVGVLIVALSVSTILSSIAM